MYSQWTNPKIPRAQSTLLHCDPVAQVHEFKFWVQTIQGNPPPQVIIPEKQCHHRAGLETCLSLLSTTPVTIKVTSHKPEQGAWREGRLRPTWKYTSASGCSDCTVAVLWKKSGLNAMCFAQLLWSEYWEARDSPWWVLDWCNWHQSSTGCGYALF